MLRRDVLYRLLGNAGAAANPALPESVASGTGSGVAMAAAAGLADVGIGIDHLSGPRVGASASISSLTRSWRSHRRRTWQ